MYRLRFRRLTTLALGALALGASALFVSPAQAATFLPTPGDDGCPACRPHRSQAPSGQSLVVPHDAPPVAALAQ